METREGNGNFPHITEDSVLTGTSEELNNVRASGLAGADTHTTRKGEIEQKLNQLMEAWAKRGQFVAERDDSGRNSRGRKDPGVGHPPTNQVKTDWENKDIQVMYEGAGYNTKRGVIHVKTNKGAPLPESMTDEECESHSMVGLVTAHMYNLKKGTELFGNKADEAVLNKLKEIDDFETYKPAHKEDLSYEDRNNALELLMKITEKREDETGNRKIKGRMAADGSKQRSYEGYEKSDGSSPTARTDSVIMTGVIDAHEGRNVAVIDVQNAFLQSENDQRIIIATRGKTAELLVRLNPELYQPYIWYSKKGVPMLHVLVSKALYGMLRAALLFYRKLRRNLEEMGFEVNPYDPCVANRDVNGTQCTVVWHVDNLKVSHCDESVVTYFASKLAKQNRDKIKIKQGKVFDCLGMDLDFGSVPGVLIISMIKYLQEVLQE